MPLAVLINLVSLLALVFALMAGGVAPSSNGLLPIFGLFYPLIFIFNALLAIFWIMMRNRFVLIPLVVFLFGLGNFSDNFQISIPSHVSKQDTLSTKVLTYNVQQFRNGQKNTDAGVKNRLLGFIEDQHADIICLQEYQSTGKQLYESIKETRDRLQLEAYYYESYFNPKYDLLSGLVIFSRYKAVGSGKLKINGSRTFGIYTDLLINGDTVRVFNIHLASIKLEKADLGFVANPDQEKLKDKSLAIYEKLHKAFLLREKQTQLLMDQVKNSPYPIMLAGDFNDTPSSWVYHQLQDYLNDSFVEEGNGISITFAGPIPLLRIDYVLHSGFETLDYHRHRFNGSDHFPVTAILQLTN